METGFVLRVVAVEDEARLVGGAEKRLGNDGAAEPVHHGAWIWTPTPNLQIVVYGLGGEIQELQVNPWRTEWRTKAEDGMIPGWTIQ